MEGIFRLMGRGLAAGRGCNQTFPEGEGLAGWLAGCIYAQGPVTHVGRSVSQSVSQSLASSHPPTCLPTCLTYAPTYARTSARTHLLEPNLGRFLSLCRWATVMDMLNFSRGLNKTNHTTGSYMLASRSVRSDTPSFTGTPSFQPSLHTTPPPPLFLNSGGCFTDALLVPAPRTQARVPSTRIV